MVYGDFKNLSWRTAVFYTYIDKLNDIVIKYNNTYHSTIKMKHVDLKLSTYIDFDKKRITKTTQNLKLVTM